MLLLQEHEYALLGGINRAKVGQYIAVLSAMVSGGIVFLILSIVDFAKLMGLSVNLPPTLLSLVGAGAVFTALYWLFDRKAWKWRPIVRWLKVPDLSGDWACRGETIGPEERRGTWTATVTIVQSWDRLRVRLKTHQSGSNSITASLLNDAADGYRLIYSYRNDPIIGETQLASHTGFANLTFAVDLQSAEGDYFNGVGRPTFGKMRLTRRAKP